MILQTSAVPKVVFAVAELSQQSAGCTWLTNCMLSRHLKQDYRHLMQAYAMVLSCSHATSEDLKIVNMSSMGPLQVRYESRRRLAETRPRVRGQFVKGASAGDSLAPDSQEQVGLSWGMLMARCISSSLTSSLILSCNCQCMHSPVLFISTLLIFQPPRWKNTRW